MSTENFSFSAEEPVSESVFEQEVSKAEVEEAIVIAEEPVAELVVEEIDPVKPAANDYKSIVVYALRDLKKAGAVDLTKGYNKISKSSYQNWKTSGAVRLASAAEIATYLK